MQFEKIRRINKSKIIVGGVITLGVIGAITILPSFAKYRLTDSINIANGVVNYKVPDFNVVAMYKSDDGENYTEIEGRMPSSDYIINEEKSYCNLITGGEDTNAVLKTVEAGHSISNLVKGDKCYLYFDKYTPPITIPDIIAANNPKNTTPDFSKVATTDEGVYAVYDGMYDGTSYYWRGAATTNYVKFANFCWRIVRINGDGSIRLIYDGATCHANGKSTAESIATASIVYNSSYNQSNYVGWTYTGISQRTLNGNSSNAKTQLENWYSSNITGTNASKVASGKYCNDRDVQSDATWTINGSSFYYAAFKRIITDRKPTLTCPNGDTYTLNVGLITMDEAMYAGGKDANNTSYYLYNGQNYWTMSPHIWGGLGAGVFLVNSNGYLTYGIVYNASGIRPVINLKADITFKQGTDGTLNNPYEVI